MSFDAVAIPADPSKLLVGPLGVVRIGYKGYDLGLTTDDTVLTMDADTKGIMYQQKGTKPADYVYTGIEYSLKTKFGEISTKLVSILLQAQRRIGANWGIGRSLYSSLSDNFAGPLKLSPVSGEDEASDDEGDILHFYTVIPILSGDFLNWGADTQRGLEVEFKILFHGFAEGESVTQKGAYGYLGDPVALDYPAISWPDVSGPEVTGIVADISAHTVEITFNAAPVLTGARVNGWAVAVKNGVAALATGGSVAGNVLTITFPVGFPAAVDDDFFVSLSAEAVTDFGGLNDVAPNTIQA